jgi:hypothetical protein
VTNPTPESRKGTPPGFARLLTRLHLAGWRVELPPVTNCRPAFAVLARGKGPRDEPVTLVIHGHSGAQELRLEDLWRVVAHMNDVQGDRAMLCLPPGAPVSELARRTAERLGVEIVPLDTGTGLTC